MKEAFGGVWLFVIVIFFLSLFSAFLALSVNYSRAFKVKDEIINIIERNNGLTTSTGKDTGAIAEIQEYLAKVGFRTTGVCEEGFTGYNLNYRDVYNDPVFCIKQTQNNDSLSSSYFTVQVFFKLEIPVLEDVFKLNIKGITKSLYLTGR